MLQSTTVSAIQTTCNSQIKVNYSKWVSSPQLARDFAAVETYLTTQSMVNQQLIHEIM